MSDLLTEREVLRQMNIPDFRHITKDKVMTFASLLQKMEPEVAKKALEQFPAFAKMALEVMKEYKGVMDKTLDENSASSKQCYDIYNEVVSALKRCLTEDDLPFEEKKYYIEKMVEIARMADKKDSENKSFNWNLIAAGSFVVLAVIELGASALGGKFSINLPKPKL